MGDQLSVVLSPAIAPLGDIDHDCRVGVSDLFAVVEQWGQAKSTGDLNGDGIVNVVDLLIVIDNWTFQ